MSAMDKKTTLFGGIAAAVVVVAVAGYFYAARAGAKQFEDFLYDNDLRNAILYRDVSYSPLTDTVTLKDVELELVLIDGGKSAKRARGDDFGFMQELMSEMVLGAGLKKKLTGSLQSLSIKGVSKKDRLQVRFSGYELITAPGQKDREQNFLYELAAEHMEAFRKLGIDGTRVSGGFNYRYDKDKDVLKVGLEMDAENIAGYSLDLELGRARRLVETKPSDLLASAIMNIEEQAEQFGRIEFVSLTSEVEDHGFLKKLAYLNALAEFRYDKALEDGIEFDAVKLQQAYEGDVKSMVGVVDERGIQALRDFHALGGNLRIKAAAKRPVRLSDVFKEGKPHRDIEVEVRT